MQLPEAIFFLRLSMATASVMVSRTPPSSLVASTAYGRKYRSSFSACRASVTSTSTRIKLRLHARVQGPTRAYPTGVLLELLEHGRTLKQRSNKKRSSAAS